MSVVAHFFVVVGGSKIHDRLAHFFIDIYRIVKGNEYSPEEDFDDIIQVSESYYNTMIEQFLAFESAKPLDAP